MTLTRIDELLSRAILIEATDAITGRLTGR